MEIKWMDNSFIRVTAEGNTVTVSANRDGLLSLSEQLRELAENEKGAHVHYDKYNSLEEGSVELIIEKL